MSKTPVQTSVHDTVQSRAFYYKLLFQEKPFFLQDLTPHCPFGANGKIRFCISQFLNTKILSPPLRNYECCQMNCFYFKGWKEFYQPPLPLPNFKLLIVCLVYDVIKKQRGVSKFTTIPRVGKSKGKLHEMWLSTISS